MGRKKAYPSEFYDELCEMDFNEFCNKYPNEDRNKLNALRRYHRKARGMEQEPISGLSRTPPDGSIGWHEVVTANPDDPENPIVTPAFRGRIERDVDDVYPQIEPDVIKPTKRKQIERIGRLAMTYGDGQVGFRRIIDPLTEEMRLVPSHNVEMHRIILQMNAHYMPETTINGGDMADNAELSRFTPDSDHYHKTMTPAYRWIHSFYAQMVADNPNAEHVETDSNHAERVKKSVLANNPAMYDFYRPGEDYPAWTYYSMANLGALGIKFVSGYKAAMYKYAEDTGNPIGFHHGHTSSSVPGATVRKERDTHPDMNIIRFHGHNYEQVMRTTRDGRQLFYIQFPSSCLNDSTTPGYQSAVDDLNQPVQYYNPNHQNGFGMIYTDEEGRHQVDFISVENGKAWYDGILWDGTQPYDWEYKYPYLEKPDEQ